MFRGQVDSLAADWWKRAVCDLPNWQFGQQAEHQLSSCINIRFFLIKSTRNGWRKCKGAAWVATTYRAFAFAMPQYNFFWVFWHPALTTHCSALLFCVCQAGYYTSVFCRCLSLSHAVTYFYRNFLGGGAELCPGRLEWKVCQAVSQTFYFILYFLLRWFCRF